MLLFFNDRCNLFPLVLSKVTASGVVSARVQDEDGAVLGRLDGSDDRLIVNAASCGIVVLVLLDLEACSFEQGPMVRPRRRGNVHRRHWVVKVSKEDRRVVTRARARNGLGRGNATVAQRLGLLAENKLGCGQPEDRVSQDRRVLVVGIAQLLLGRSDGRENVRLRVLVTVRSGTQADLVGS